VSLLSRIGRFFGLAEAPPMPMGDLAAFECWADGVGATAATRADLAVRIATVHTCVKVLAESVASLPCKLYRKVGDRREIAEDHPINDFVGWRPGPRLTPFDLFEYGVTSMAFTGISAYQKVVDGTGRLLDLVGLEPTRLKPLDAEGTRYSYALANGKRVEFTRRELWLCSYWMGLSPLAVAASQVEQAEAQDAHAAGYFRNNAVLGGTLEYPGKLSDEAKVKLRADWATRHQGASRAWGIGLLDGGLKFTPFTVSNRDAQFLEARRFTAEQIAAIFRVPLHMLNDLTRATFSNVEHQDIAFVKHCLRPWLERLEQSMNRDLLTEEERRDHYFAFSVDAILRGDYPTRMQGYAVGIQNGILTPNEARAFEDLPPKDGGDELLLPMNSRPGGVASTAPQGGRGPAGTPETAPSADADEVPEDEKEPSDGE
jgi:HK97 family phage portal protein